MNQQKLWILFFGRLDDEKWFGLILQVLKLFIKNHGGIPFQFYVFGKWKYEKELLDLWQNYNCIHFFGRQSLETIKKYQDNCNFCLMPSTFLETFGLTALNSLAMWIPVIWFAKWGLTQFIPNKYDISQAKWIDDTDKLYNKLLEIIKAFNEWKIKPDLEKKKAVATAKNFTIEKRFENIQPIIGKPKKILLVSDFKSKLWWIETYLYDVSDILTSKWYEVKIFGTNIPWWKIWQYLKYFGLCLAIFNRVDAIKLKKEIRTFMPKVVRYNSTLRWLGRFPIKITKDENIKKLMMYHDLGYFHPYPSQVTQEDMVQTPLTLRNFIKSANTKNPLKICAVICKYRSVTLLRKRLIKTIDLHLVPSQFMEKIVSESYRLPDKKVKTLSHFIQK